MAISKPRTVVSGNPTKGTGAVSLSTNGIARMSSAVTYELMVAWHSMAGPVARKKFFDEAFEELEFAFGQYIDTKAKSNPKALQHVYEWGQNGSVRLWRIKRTGSNDDGFKIKFNFVQSKTVAPIDPILKIAGPSGKVVKKSSIFKNKATVIELGTPVIIKRKTSNWLAIPSYRMSSSTSSNGITFSKGPIVINNPGGREAKLMFTKSFSGWFTNQGSRMVKNSNAVKKLEKRAKLAGQNPPTRIRNISMSGKVSFSEIDSMAERMVNGL